MPRVQSTDFSVSIEEGTAIYARAVSGAQDRFDALQLAIPQRPMDDNGRPFSGHLPPNVADLPTMQLAQFYTLMCNYADYLEGLCTIARAEVLNAERAFKLIKAKVRQTKSGTAQERDDQCITDSRYIEADADLIEAETYRELLEGLAKAASRDRAVVSRIIETKKMELENKRRDTGLGNYRSR